MEPGDNNGNINRNHENYNSASMTFSANSTMQKSRIADEIEPNLFDNNSQSSLHDLDNNNDCEGTFAFQFILIRRK